MIHNIHHGQHHMHHTASTNGSVASSSLRSESPPNGRESQQILQQPQNWTNIAISPIQQLDHYQLERNPRYSTIGRPGRGLHHHLHNTSGISNSPVRSVVIVAPGDPIPPNLPPQQQLQLQQLSTDLPLHQLTLTRPPSEASSNLYG